MLQNNGGDCYLCHERGPVYTDYAPEYLCVLHLITKQSKGIELEDSDTNKDEQKKIQYSCQVDSNAVKEKHKFSAYLKEFCDDLENGSNTAVFTNDIEMV